MAIVINGAVVDPKHATVSIFDRGFQYGDGLFETIAVVRGAPLFWDEHLRRMSAGAGVLGIPMPDVEVWKNDARAAVDPQCEREVLKLILTRGVGGRGYGRPFPKVPTRIAYTAIWPAYPANHWADGVDVVTCRIAQLGGSEFTTVKSLNRLNHVLARAELPDGVPEGLLLDTSGYVREGTFTNVLWFRAGRAQTPQLKNTGIAGVMRGAILERLRKKGIACDTVDAPAGAIADSDECLVCNSLIGVWPVRSIDGNIVKACPGPVTLDLLDWSAAMGLEKA